MNKYKYTCNCAATPWQPIATIPRETKNNGLFGDSLLLRSHDPRTRNYVIAVFVRNLNQFINEETRRNLDVKMYTHWAEIKSI